MNSPPSGPLATLFQAQGRKMTYAKGELLHLGGTLPTGTYMIEAGFVEVYSLNKQDERSLHFVFGPGEVFPLSWILGHSRGNIYYEALATTTVWLLPVAVLESYLNQSPEAFDFIRQVIEQSTLYATRIDNLEYKYARERLAYRILLLAARFGEKQDKEVLLPSAFTQQRIADSINLSRESVSRELDRLERRGTLEVRGRQIVICDIVALSSELDEASGADYWKALGLTTDNRD